MPQLNILVSGAGIAGNALAFWLSKAGHNVTVIEYFPELRTSGLQIDLRGHGLEVLKRMGLEQKGRARTIPEQGTRILDTSGKQWAYFPVNRSGQGVQSFSTEFEIMRSDLTSILYNAASQEGTRHVFSQSIKSFVEGEDEVAVTFSDGTTDRFDLLVGADGVRSRTRRLFLGSDHPRVTKNLGVMGAFFAIPQPRVPGEDYNGNICFATGKRIMFTRRHNDDELQVYLSCVSKSDRLEQAQKLGVDEQKAALAEVFQGAGWKIDEYLKAMKETDNFYYDSLNLVDMDAWHSRRVAFVGDAAYCPTATTGMGTTSAMIGAYILAGEINKFCGPSGGSKNDIGQALKQYDETFRPFMKQVQHGIAESSFWTMIPSSSFGIAIMNLLFSVVSFFRLDVLGKYILREDVKDWTLPEYDPVTKSLRT